MTAFVEFVETESCKILRGQFQISALPKQSTMGTWKLNMSDARLALTIVIISLFTFFLKKAPKPKIHYASNFFLCLTLRFCTYSLNACPKFKYHDINYDINYGVLGKMPPGKLPPGKLPPMKFCVNFFLSLTFIFMKIFIYK